MTTDNQKPNTSVAPPAKTTVAPKAQPPTIKSLLEGESFKLQVAKTLPTHLKPERFLRVAMTAIMRTPKLAECDHASFFKALLDLSSMGLEPDGRRAHLIPFNNNKRNCVECQLIIDYKGLVDLAQRSGLISNLHADVVCENDQFSYNMGEVEFHRIDFKQERGEPYAAYAICTFKDGTKKAEVMSMHEIDAIRKRSKAANAGPWVTDYNEMSKKTVFRRLSKWLPLSPEYRDAVEKDADVLPELSLTATVDPSSPKRLKRAEVVSAGQPAAAAAVETPPAGQEHEDDIRMEEGAAGSPAGQGGDAGDSGAGAEAGAPANDFADAELDNRTELTDKLALTEKYKGVSFKKECAKLGVSYEEWKTAPTAALELLAKNIKVE